MLKRVGANAYMLNLLGNMNVFATFNVADLQAYLGRNSDNDSNSRTSHSQPGEPDTVASNSKPKRNHKQPAYLKDYHV